MHSTEMRNRLGCISLCQQRVTKQLMSRDQVRVQFQSVFKGNSRGSVLVTLHESLSKIDKAFREGRIEFGYLAIFGDGEIEILLTFSTAGSVEVLSGLW